MYSLSGSVKNVVVGLLGLASVFDGYAVAQNSRYHFKLCHLSSLLHASATWPQLHPFMYLRTYPHQHASACPPLYCSITSSFISYVLFKYGRHNGHNINGRGPVICYEASANNSSTNDCSYTPVIGVPDRVVERKPITELQREFPDVFNMFVLAMESIHDRNERDDESYFQIAGIHGFPFITWQYPVSAVVNPDTEYCTHGSVIFSTWHRPYLVLLEQVLHEEAVRIANQFSDYQRPRYLRAAEDVRLPYWDWASEETIPSVVSSPTIEVVKPRVNGTGGRTTIDNPLFSYEFQNDLPPNAPGQDETIRGANPNGDLQATFPGRQTSTLDIFTIEEYNDFNFALEGIHNSIHGISFAFLFDFSG